VPGKNQRARGDSQFVFASWKEKEKEGPSESLFASESPKIEKKEGEVFKEGKRCGGQSHFRESRFSGEKRKKRDVWETRPPHRRENSEGKHPRKGKRGVGLHDSVFPREERASPPTPRALRPRTSTKKEGRKIEERAALKERKEKTYPAIFEKKERLKGKVKRQYRRTRRERKRTKKKRPSTLAAFDSSTIRKPATGRRGRIASGEEGKKGRKARKRERSLLSTSMISSTERGKTRTNWLSFPY